MIQFKTLSFFFSIVVVLFFESCKPTTKDEPKIVEANTVLDIDGNLYHTVTIGTQTWMVENLKTTKYRNGDLIGTTSPANKDISLETTPKYQWAYNGNDSNVIKYGRLYTWYAVVDNRNIAPTGWHVSTSTEWTTLVNYVSTHYGTSLSTAKALAATTDWVADSQIGAIGNNLSSNNYSGFNALPGGFRNGIGIFNYLGRCGDWWGSTTEGSMFGAWGSNLWSSYSSNVGDFSGNDKSNGFSVRCVKDSL